MLHVHYPSLHSRHVFCSCLEQNEIIWQTYWDFPGKFSENGSIFQLTKLCVSNKPTKFCQQIIIMNFIKPYTTSKTTCVLMPQLYCASKTKTNLAMTNSRFETQGSLLINVGRKCRILLKTIDFYIKCTCNLPTLLQTNTSETLSYTQNETSLHLSFILSLAHSSNTVQSQLKMLA